MLFDLHHLLFYLHPLLLKSVTRESCFPFWFTFFAFCFTFFAFLLTSFAPKKLQQQRILFCFLIHSIILLKTCGHAPIVLWSSPFKDLPPPPFENWNRSQSLICTPVLTPFLLLVAIFTTDNNFYEQLHSLQINCPLALTNYFKEQQELRRQNIFAMILIAALPPRIAQRPNFLVINSVIYTILYYSFKFQIHQNWGKKTMKHAMADLAVIIQIFYPYCKAGRVTKTGTIEQWKTQQRHPCSRQSRVIIKTFALFCLCFWSASVLLLLLLFLMPCLMEGLPVYVSLSLFGTSS